MHQIKASLYRQPPPYSLEYLKCILPTIYNGELYLKRLQRADLGYYLLIHIKRLIDEHGSVDTDAIYIGDFKYYLIKFRHVFQCESSSDPEPFDLIQVKISRVNVYQQILNVHVGL